MTGTRKRDRWIDISTGAFRVAETALERLAADIFRVDPKELIVAEPVFHDPALKPLFDTLGRVAGPQPPSLFDSASAASRIARFFDVATPDGFGAFSRAELSAISGAIAYVEKTQKSQRPPLSRPEREESGATLFIDPATRTNLELLRSMSGSRDGSLFRAVDRTVTGAGARLLAERLMAPLTDPVAIGRRLDAVSFLVADPATADALRQALKAVPDIARALSRLALNRGGPRDLGALRAGLAAAGLIEALLNEPPHELAAAGDAIAALPADLLARLQGALADELPLLKRDGGFVASGYDAELDEVRALRDQSRRVIAAMERDLIEETGIRSLKIRHNNVLGYYIEVTANHQAIMNGSAEAKSRFIHRQTMASAMRFTTTGLAELESKIANAADRALAIELGVFERLVGEAVANADAILAGARALAVLDVSAALAVLARTENYARPTVDDSLVFRIEGGRHPVVEQAHRRLAAEAFVANDCDLSPAAGGRHGAIWLLTGPQHGRQIDVPAPERADCRARPGGLLRARNQRPHRRRRPPVQPRRRVRRPGARPVDLHGRDGRDRCDPQPGRRTCLVILDEIGRGTATFDGLSIAWAAVEYLHEKNRCRAIFATHFHEMTALSSKLPRLTNVTMRVKEWEGDVVFLHEVAKGAADRSYGVQVARLAGLPDAVVQRARDVLHQLESGESSGRADRLVDDLPLFSAAMRREQPTPAKVDALGEAISALEPGRADAEAGPGGPLPVAADSREGLTGPVATTQAHLAIPAKLRLYP